MSRKFVLVTASYVQNGKPVFASGIRKLKRGTTILQFMFDYLTSLNVDPEKALILKREETYAVAHDELSWNFTEYDEADLFSAVAHLSKDELLRDLKELLPLRVA